MQGLASGDKRDAAWNGPPGVVVRSPVALKQTLALGSQYTPVHCELTAQADIQARSERPEPMDVTASPR